MCCLWVLFSRSGRRVPCFSLFICSACSWQWERRIRPHEIQQETGKDKLYLYCGGEPAGFFELDARAWPDVNLSYFGLMPHAVGSGVGLAFLRCAVDEVWRRGARRMTVNTCTADHPRAMRTYLRAGFHVVRRVREIWSVPNHLGLRIPPGLRV